MAQDVATEVSTQPILDVSSVPEIIGYDTAVSRGHILRLREEEGENLNQVVFLNTNGTRTMYLFDFPVKYRDAGNQIQDISLDYGLVEFYYQVLSGEANAFCPSCEALMQAYINAATE